MMHAASGREWGVGRKRLRPVVRRKKIRSRIGSRIRTLSLHRRPSLSRQAPVMSKQVALPGLLGLAASDVPPWPCRCLPPGCPFLAALSSTSPNWDQPSPREGSTGRQRRAPSRHVSPDRACEPADKDRRRRHLGLIAAPPEDSLPPASQKLPVCLDQGAPMRGLHPPALHQPQLPARSPARQARSLAPHPLDLDLALPRH